MGSAIAHRIFGAKPTVVVQQAPPAPAPAPTVTGPVVASVSAEYTQCMKESNDDKEACKQFLA
jgi:hypothetical protein